MRNDTWVRGFLVRKALLQVFRDNDLVAEVSCGVPRIIESAYVVPCTASWHMSEPAITISIVPASRLRPTRVIVRFRGRVEVIARAVVRETQMPDHLDVRAVMTVLVR